MADQNEQRELTLNSLNDVIAEAERLAAIDVVTTGKHDFAHILEHLALAFKMSAGKIQGPRPPFVMRLMMPIIRMMIFAGKPLKPGIKLPPDAEGFFWPEREIEVEEALAHLKDAVAEYQATDPLPAHPVFGKSTREQNESLNIRHAALHLSFVHECARAA